MALHAIITMVLREMAAWLSNFTSKKIVTVAHQKDTGNGTHPDLGELARGDIVAYYDSSGNICIPKHVPEMALPTMSRYRTLEDLIISHGNGQLHRLVIGRIICTGQIGIQKEMILLR